MVLQPVVWILIAIAALVIGRQLGKWLFGAKKEASNLKRAMQTLAITLREHGLRRLPAMLEEAVVGDVSDMFVSIKEFATMLKAGNEAIVKELDSTFDRMLGVKLTSPETRAVIKAKIQEAEKVALEVAKAAAPYVAAAAIAAL